MINFEGECRQPSSSCLPLTRNVTSSLPAIIHAERPVFLKQNKYQILHYCNKWFQDYNIYKILYVTYTSVINNFSRYLLHHNVSKSEIIEIHPFRITACDAGSNVSFEAGRK